MFARLAAVISIAVLAGCSDVNTTTGNGSAALTPLSSSVNSAVAHGTIEFAANGYIVAQDARSLNLSVTRVGGAVGAVSATYSTDDATAIAGTDYLATQGTLSWGDNDASARTITLTILNGTPFAGTKTFALSMGHAVGGAAVATARTVVTINGDAAPQPSAPSPAPTPTPAPKPTPNPAPAPTPAPSPTPAPGPAPSPNPAPAPAPIATPVTAGYLSLSALNYTAAQNAGALTISVNRTGGSAGAVSVGYGTADNSAKAGTDYIATSGVLRWAAGDSADKTFSISISDTKPFFGTKTFAIAISGAGGGTLGTPATATATIAGAQNAGTTTMGEAAASRLLSQATFGPTLDTISAAANQTYDAWFAAQVAATPSLTLPSVPSRQTDWYPFWLTNAVKGPDQLRQRVAFALSEIFVVSENGGPLQYQDQAIAAYSDLLVQGAFTNYRSLLERITLSVQMGQYLSMFRNDKANAALNSHADENYARELMQLFSIGLVQLNLDGSPKADSSGAPIPTYAQTDVEQLARVFTGWASTPNGHPLGESSWLYDVDYLHPMIAYADHHDTGAKTVLGVAIAAGGSASGDLKIALDTIFNHPNVGPFLGRQLIQRMVTSNPSPAYVARVASVFNNNGQGVRGDLSAVIKAILTDPEAVSLSGDGKLREPLLRLTHLWRAFNAADSTGKVDEPQVIENSLATFAEEPLQSPSVFNFFNPTYERAGPLTNAGLAVPEFQITNENTLVLTANQNLTEVYDFIDSQGTKHAGYQGYSQVSSLGATSVLLKTAQWEAFAATPATLVAKLNLVLMQDQMPPAMQASLVNYVAKIPPGTPWYRVVEAAELVIDSPQYSIQR